MNKIIYLAIVGDVKNGSTAGVYSKVVAQIRALNKIGKNCSGLLGGAGFEDDPDDAIRTVKLKKAVLGFDLRHFFKTSLRAIEAYKPDAIYIRYPLSRPSFILFLRQVKNQYPDLKVIVEKQTVEVTELWLTKSIRNTLLVAQEMLFRKHVLKKIDVVIGVTQQICRHNSDLGAVKTVYMGNGIASKVVEYNPPKSVDIGNNIVITYVGNLTKWSALDEFIDYLVGIDFSLDGRSIFFNIIGGGSESKRLSRRSEKFERITFHGFKKGDELNEIVSNSTWCLGSFGNGKRGLSEGSNLKLRLYCSLGTPFIYFEYDADFDNNVLPKSVRLLEVRNSNQEVFIDIFEHISDCSKSGCRRNELILFANKYLTWERKFTKLFKEVED